MTANEMRGDDLLALKRKFIVDENRKKGRGTSWLELEAAGELVTDEEARGRYEGVDLSGDDLDEYR